MHLKAVLVVVVVDTVGIAIVLHEHEREASGEDGIQVAHELERVRPGLGDVPRGVVTVMSTTPVPAGLVAVITVPVGSTV